MIPAECSANYASIERPLDSNISTFQPLPRSRPSRSLLAIPSVPTHTLLLVGPGHTHNRCSLSYPCPRRQCSCCPPLAQCATGDAFPQARQPSEPAQRLSSSASDSELEKRDTYTNVPVTWYPNNNGPDACTGQKSSRQRLGAWSASFRLAAVYSPEDLGLVVRRALWPRADPIDDEYIDAMRAR
jgi:hypothetical protein